MLSYMLAIFPQSTFHANKFIFERIFFCSFFCLGNNLPNLSQLVRSVSTWAAPSHITRNFCISNQVLTFHSLVFNLRCASWYEVAFFVVQVGKPAAVHIQSWTRQFYRFTVLGLNIVGLVGHIVASRDAQRVRLDCDREASHNLNRLLYKPGTVQDQCTDQWGQTRLIFDSERSTLPTPIK